MSMYRLNNLSGKIVRGGAERLGQSLKPASGETPQIIFESKKVKFPSVSSATMKPRKAGVGEVPSTLLRKYEHFQVDNNVPIHIKGGTTDVALYYLTLVGCAVGIFECFRYYYDAAFPKKVE